MIKKSLIVYGVLFLIPLFSISQELKIGLGIIPIQEKFSNSLVQIDTLSVYEGNLKSSGPVLMPYIQYSHSFGDKIKGTISLQYYELGASIFVSTPLDGMSIESKKGTTISSKNMEFPIGGSFNLFDKDQLKFKLMGAIVPVVCFSSSTYFNEVPEGGGWTQEIVDALNAAETIPKKYYTNYLYGFSVDYWRLGLSFTRNHNFSSISNDYVLYGQSYRFERKVVSNRITLYYTLVRKG